MSSAEVAAIATALENDASFVLQSLTLSVDHTSQLQALVQSLPKMKHLRKLNVYCQRAVDNSRYNYVLPLHAFKRNTSLWQVTTDIVTSNGEAAELRMKFYTERNKQIQAILKAPMDMVQKTPLANWPRIFVLMRDCEMQASILFSALVTLGEFVGPRDSVNSNSK
jgi:hypothetical protein